MTVKGALLETEKIIALFGLLQLLLENLELEQAQNILQEIQTLEDKYSGTQAANLVSLSQYSQLAKILVLKHDSRITQKSQAQTLLTNLINENVLNHHLNSLAMIHLSDLLLAEFKMYNQSTALKELQALVQKLNGIGQTIKI
ncbi:MAG: hypothetical protein ACW967_04540 [Candidatus Hodarchaeales archaeon]|jgi:hypothetical protein